MSDGRGREEMLENLEFRRGQILARIALRSGRGNADLVENLMEIDSQILFLRNQKAEKTFAKSALTGSARSQGKRGVCSMAPVRNGRDSEP